MNTYDATLPTVIEERPVKLIVALAAELAVYTKMPGPVVEIVTLAVKPPVVTTLAFSKIGPRKLAILIVVVLAIAMESASLSPVIEALAKSEAAILPAAISLPVICCKPILYLYYYSFIYVS
jgi:hypothetical protein